MHRAYTADEARAIFLREVKALAEYWGHLAGKSQQEVADGVAFSLLALLDGAAMDFCAVDILLKPHPDDTAYQQDQGAPWFEAGQNIAGSLHTLWHTAEDA
ncbi:MAG: hypothetical protein AB7N91_15385 [Candidatus Tectimicrobiota bacterium]